MAFGLSFAIEESFFADHPGVTAAQARAATLRALQSWSTGLEGLITFNEATWAAVPNDGEAPPFSWEGPGWEEWIADYHRPPEEQLWPGSRAGWGANIDVFSRPTGFTITSSGINYVMGSQNLGFSVINRTGNQILSVDIYLNSSAAMNWTDGPGGFDLETVILHELGHALGFDHPQEAVQYGSVNLHPQTYQPGFPWSPTDVMHPAYTGVKRDLTDDELGGMTFLYNLVSENPLIGDFTMDGFVNASDLAVLLAVWGKQNAVCDLNNNGVVDAGDLAELLARWTGSTPG
ncbi:MAG: matrixin family metalloprotease [Planctomycetota bacterium]|nr:matrixin family metalloprotease [Planctomycetota bacterium]